MPTIPESEIREIILERVKLRSGVAISKELLDQATVRVSDTLGWAADQMAVALDTEILAQKHARHSRLVEWSFPATPWQHLKARLGGRFGRWVRRTWPVIETLKHVRIDYEAQTMFPEATVRYPKELGRPIHVVTDVPTVWTEGENDDA